MLYYFPTSLCKCKKMSILSCVDLPLKLTFSPNILFPPLLLSLYRCISRQQRWQYLSASVHQFPWECSTCPRSMWFFFIQSRMSPSASAAWRQWSLQPPCPTSSTPREAWGQMERQNLNSVKVWKHKVCSTPHCWSKDVETANISVKSWFYDETF